MSYVIIGKCMGERYGACVEVCPTGARVFGDLEAAASPLRRLKRMSELQVLKPSLNTEPKVLYSRLDGKVI